MLTIVFIATLVANTATGAITNNNTPNISDNNMSNNIGNNVCSIALSSLVILGIGTILVQARWI